MDVVDVSSLAGRKYDYQMKTYEISVISHHRKAGGTPLDSLWFSQNKCCELGVLLDICWSGNLLLGVKSILKAGRVLFDGMGAVKLHWGPVFYVLTVLFRKPIAVYWHETGWYFDQLFRSNPSFKGFLAQCLFRHLLSNKRVIHFHVNQYGVSLLRDRFDVSINRSFVLENVSDDRPLLKYQLPQKPGKRMFVACGAVCERKGTDIFIDIAEKVINRGVDAHFCWIGAFGSDNFSEAALLEELKNRGIADKVSFIGHQDAPHETIIQSTAFLLTSRDDPMPKVLMEALALGKQCIAFDVGGVRHLLGELGVVIPLGDIEHFVNILCGEIPEGEKEQLARRQRYVEQFSPDAFAKRFSNIIHKL